MPGKRPRVESSDEDSYSVSEVEQESAEAGGENEARPKPRRAAGSRLRDIMKEEQLAADMKDSE